MNPELRQEWLAVQARLERRQTNQSLHGMYLELAPLVGRLQGNISESARANHIAQDLSQAEESFEQLKASYRKVGLDIRLASDRAILIGLQSVVQYALDTLDHLDPPEQAD
jgi:hypothetical protein